jgi:transposase InsO family protein
MNKLKQPEKEEKRRIIKERAGQLGHVDCHYLTKDLIVGTYKRSYLLCVIDSYSRLAWAELIHDIKSLTAMFTTLKSINFLNVQYGIKFEEMLSDNGSEFSSRSKKSRYDHPFERMLMEMGIKHRYTRPYRPQTNGKVERFWRTLNEDLIEGTTFESFEEFNEKLQEYLFYYNEHRPHQALNGLPPKKFLEKKLSTN